MKTAYLSLGSNLGNRQRHLQGALDRLQAAGIQLVCKSSVFETEPQDLPDQPWFLNLVAQIETRLFPMQLLARIQRIEREMGRQRFVAKGPRTIDIDILLYGRFVIQTAELEIPHPRMEKRRFVLEPLAELAPDLRHPIHGKSIQEMLGAVTGQPVRKWKQRAKEG